MVQITGGDEAYMARAIALARKGQYTCRPNPSVGCVIVNENQIVGEGWHWQAGGPHAEINALDAAGNRSHGATAYVTLAPCDHYGRTPPCSQALIKAGIRRLVYGCDDPNEAARGGLARLEQAGITVAGPVLEADALALNTGFFQRVRTGLPRVRAKIAASLDGATAMASGESKWITGPAARSDVQRLRARSGAIVTGIGTVLADNPALTVRARELELTDAAAIAELQPLRVIVDSRFRVNEDLQILRQPGEALVVTARKDCAVDGAQTVTLANGEGKVALPELLYELGRRQINDVLIEAGAKLTGAFINEGLVDELIIYLAPKLMGSRTRPMTALAFDKMSDALDLELSDVRAVGDDLRITAQLRRK